MTDEIRKKEENSAPQEVPAISGGPELNKAELSEDDDKRKKTDDETDDRTE